MSKHTPGPWEMAHAGHGGKDGFVVDECFVRREGDSVAIAADIIDPETCRPSEANANLVASAPELLALLVELVDIEGPQPGNSEWGDKARALIAKATGGKA